MNQFIAAIKLKELEDKLKSAEIIVNKDGSIYHLCLYPEQVSKNIILVGDPKRSKIGTREARRISLSSVRTPRLGRRDRDEAEPWAFQSKEYMRNLLIGKSVRVTVEYTRSSNNNK